LKGVLAVKKVIALLVAILITFTSFGIVLADTTITTRIVFIDVPENYWAR